MSEKGYVHENPNDLALKKLYDEILTPKKPSDVTKAVQNVTKNVTNIKVGKVEIEKAVKSVVPKEEKEPEPELPEVPEGAELINLEKNKLVIQTNRTNVSKNSRYKAAILPAYIIRLSTRKIYYAYRVDILGPSTFIDQRENPPLRSKANAWLETESPVIIYNPMTFQESEELRKEYEASE